MRRLIVFYRVVFAQNTKDRPPFFDKAVCLLSCLRAAEAAGAELRFVVDGPVSDEWTAFLGRFGEVSALPGLGNSGSYLETIRRAARADADWVYLCEDDYLHQPDAFLRLGELLDEVPGVRWVSLYEHPNAYRAGRLGGADREDYVFFAAGTHWRTISSTCMTYAAPVESLGRTLPLHETISADPFPSDFLWWQTVQGPIGRTVGSRNVVPRRRARVLKALARRGVLRRGTERRLVSPIPSLATHLDEGVEALGVDWAAVAADTRAWAADAGIEPPPIED